MTAMRYGYDLDEHDALRTTVMSSLSRRKN
jgi:hypothetical protein